LILARKLKDGGKIIGYLERSLIYLFVLVDQPSAIGFLIAAKSVFRFGEIRQGTNRMEAEYILIGTLLSFLFGLVVSFSVQKLLLLL
jgi:ABC-type proline/glycine betaine transport system permease subunit